MRGQVVGIIDGLNEVLIQFYDKHSLERGDIIQISDEKKTLTQLGYYRTLIREMARKLGTSEAFQHNMMLRHLRIYKKIDDHLLYTFICADDNDVLEDEENHLEPTKETRVGKNGEIWTTYRVLKGTRYFTKEEMSRLIEATVAEANQQGIATMSEAQWRRLRLGTEK